MSDTAPSPVPPSRMRRWAPALVGLAFAGLGLGAAGVGLSQVEISVRPPEAPSDEADPLDLLRDDVRTVQLDLQRLSAGLGQNLEALAQGLDGNAEARHAERSDALAALDARLTAFAQREAEACRELAQLRQALAARPAAAPVPDGEAREPATEDTRPAPEETLVAEALQPEPPPATTPKRKRGLFSFKLAGGGPDFTHTQRYQVIGSLSRVGFDAKSTLHDFSGVTSKVEGTLTARLDRDDPQASAMIRAAAAVLKTGVDGRDEEMRKVLAVEEHPWIRFDLAGLTVSTSDPEARTYRGTAHGTFTIRGVTRELDVPVEISVDASRRLVVSGQATLELPDFGVEVPTVAGAISVEEQVKVWLSLRLRSLGDAGEKAQ